MNKLDLHNVAAMSANAIKKDPVSSTSKMHPLLWAGIEIEQKDGAKRNRFEPNK